MLYLEVSFVYNTMLFLCNEIHVFWHYEVDSNKMKQNHFFPPLIIKTYMKKFKRSLVNWIGIDYKNLHDKHFMECANTIYSSCKHLTLCTPGKLLVWLALPVLLYGTIKHLIQSIRSIIPMNKLLSFFGTVLICLCIVYAWVFIHLQYTGAPGRCQKIQPIRVAFFFFSNSLHSDMYIFWPGLCWWNESFHGHIPAPCMQYSICRIQCVVRL